MAAWGPGNFENDQVLDWLDDLDDPQTLRETLAAVVGASSESYLDADACCHALGAAEVVAACGGRPGLDVPGEVTSWAAAHPGVCDAEVRDLALAAVARIDGASELQQLFDGGGRDEGWHATLKELASRLALAR